MSEMHKNVKILVIAPYIGLAKLFEEAYKDWRLRLAGERRAAAAGEGERRYEEMDAQRRSLVESEAYWREVTGADGDDTAAWVTDAAGGDDGAARELDDVAAGAASAAVSSAGLDTVDDDDAGYGEAVRVDRTPPPPAWPPPSRSGWSGAWNGMRSTRAISKTAISKWVISGTVRPSGRCPGCAVSGCCARCRGVWRRWTGSCFLPSIPAG